MQPLTIPAYNRTINISPPLLPDFDIRSFEDNMGQVPNKIKPFRIGFFQIAILESGGGRVSSDGSDYDLKNCTLFFNLSNQIIYWDISPDWRGYYCCLPEAAYTSSLVGYSTLADFPFFQHPHPGIHLSSREALRIVETMRRIHEKYQDTDNTHHALRTKTLIDQACKMLATSEQTVGEIAGLLGFSSQAYFSRVFAKLKDQSPTAYREEC